MFSSIFSSFFVLYVVLIDLRNIMGGLTTEEFKESFFLFSPFFFSFYTCICASVFVLTCNLIFFNANVNWLPGSAIPYGYPRQSVL